MRRLHLNWSQSRIFHFIRLKNTSVGGHMRRLHPNWSEIRKWRFGLFFVLLRTDLASNIKLCQWEKVRKAATKDPYP